MSDWRSMFQQRVVVREGASGAVDRLEWANVVEAIDADQSEAALRFFVHRRPPHLSALRQDRLRRRENDGRRIGPAYAKIAFSGN